MDRQVHQGVRGLERRQRAGLPRRRLDAAGACGLQTQPRPGVGGALLLGHEGVIRWRCLQLGWICVRVGVAVGVRVCTTPERSIVASPACALATPIWAPSTHSLPPSLPLPSFCLSLGSPPFLAAHSSGSSACTSTSAIQR